MGFIRAGIACLMGLAMVACGPSSPEPSSPFKAKAVYVRPAAKADVVECLDPKAETPAWISNGSVGVRVGRDGSGSLPNGDQSVILNSSKYSPSGEEKILGGPSPLPTNVRLDDEPILGREISHYVQQLSIKGCPNALNSKWMVGQTALETTAYVDEFGVTYFAIASKSLAKPAALSVDFDIPGLRFDSFGTMGGMSLVQGEGKKGSAVLVSGTVDRPDIKNENEKSTVSIRLPKGAFKITYCYIADVNAGHLLPKIQRDFADIEVEGPVEDQQAIRSFLIYLRGSVPIDAETPVSPLNTSGPTYNGHVFWDADIWVFPALALLDPERAKTISNYRIAKAAGAEKNFKERKSWIRNAPTAQAVAGIDTLQYPWESSVSGLEVSPTETKQQHHITGDVVWGLDMAAALGLADSAKVEAIGRKAAKFYQFRATAIDHETPNGPKDQTAKFRSILDTVSPDEHYFGDHDLYTNAIAEWTVKRFDPADKGLPFFLTRDGAGFLNYGGDRMKGYKQAAGALAIYPLQNPAVEKEARLFMDRFGDKVSKNGPAMTDSVHALIWARLGEKTKAYETWRKSWMEFTNHPLMLFSEKRNKDVTYFSTGAAGCLQTVLYGFLGIRIDTKAQPGAKWSIPLKGGKVLSIKPNLPNEWKSVKVKGLSVLGKRYELVFRGDNVAVTPI